MSRVTKIIKMYEKASREADDLTYFFSAFAIIFLFSLFLLLVILIIFKTIPLPLSLGLLVIVFGVGGFLINYVRRKK